MIDYLQIIKESEEKLQQKFKAFDEISFYNQKKVLKAFQKNRIALRHFSGTTGYGYGDEGREALSKLYADVFNAEDGIVSPNILSGTHALTVALFGILRPNDLLLTITGEPYDTLIDVIKGDNCGSLKEFGVKYQAIPLIDEKFDEKTILSEIELKRPKMVYIQRSRGYELRDAFSVDEIGKIISKIRNIGYNGCIFVDNCYGEFVETQEPTDVGANICVGSLIKNAGGGLASTGGYIVGKKEYIDLIAKRLTAPSIGSEVGSYAYGYQYYFQGLFLASHTVNQALKGSFLIGTAMDSLGYKNYPTIDKMPADITRAIEFKTDKELISFIQSVQSASPIDSFVTLEPWEMPGYDSKVIMAAGCFVQGSSIELSADAPIKQPYLAYFQGGLTYEHAKYALEIILKSLPQK